MSNEETTPSQAALRLLALVGNDLELAFRTLVRAADSLALSEDEDLPPQADIHSVVRFLVEEYGADQLRTMVDASEEG